MMNVRRIVWSDTFILSVIIAVVVTGAISGTPDFDVRYLSMLIVVPTGGFLLAWWEQRGSAVRD